jgi:aminomethyltransferase
MKEARASLHDPRTHWRQPLAPTPFHPRTAAANRLNAWGPWAGYTTALAFDDPVMEHAAIRNQATLCDLSPMTKYRIAGPDAASCLDRLTLRAASRLAVGAVHYTAWCDDDGKVLDDGTLFRLGPDEFRLCCQERHLPWLLDSAEDFDATVEEVTEAVAALALQGPCAFAALRAAGFGGAGALRPFRLAEFPLGRGGRVTISRTGFTGDLGYELWTTPDRALELWDLLTEAGAPWGVRPVGTQALDLARIEAGFIVAGMDFVPAGTALRPDRARSPFELGLGWMVDLDKGPFTGRRALAGEKAAGSSRWALVGLDVEGNVPAEQALVYHGRRREVGYVTAAAWSPTTKRNIALASVERPFAGWRGDDLRVEIYARRELRFHRLMVRARVAPRPFFDHPRRRATPPGDC